MVAESTGPHGFSPMGWWRMPMSSPVAIITTSTHFNRKSPYNISIYIYISVLTKKHVFRLPPTMVIILMVLFFLVYPHIFLVGNHWSITFGGVFPTISSHYPLHGGRTPPRPAVAVWKAPPSSVGASWVWFSHKRCPKFGSKQSSFNGEEDDEP